LNSEIVSSGVCIQQTRDHSTALRWPTILRNSSLDGLQPNILGPDYNTFLYFNIIWRIDFKFDCAAVTRTVIDQDELASYICLMTTVVVV
jgi:hypothetical protein